MCLLVAAECRTGCSISVKVEPDDPELNTIQSLLLKFADLVLDLESRRSAHEVTQVA